MLNWYGLPPQLNRRELLGLDFEGILNYFRVSLPRKFQSEEECKQFFQSIFGFKVRYRTYHTRCNCPIPRLCTVSVPGSVQSQFQALYSISPRFCTVSFPGSVQCQSPALYSVSPRFCTVSFPGSVQSQSQTLCSLSPRLCTVSVPGSVQYQSQALYMQSQSQALYSLSPSVVSPSFCLKK